MILHVWSKDKVDMLLKLHEQGLTNREKAERMEEYFGERFNTNTIKKKIHRMNARPVSTNNQEYRETVEINSDGSHRSDKLLRMSAEQCKDEKFLLNAHGYDPNEWQIINVKSSIWNQHNKQDGTLTLYASKIAVKPKDKTISQLDVKELVKDIMKDYKSPIYEPTRYSMCGKLLEVNISDLHINKLGYKDGEYNHEQAEKIFFYVLNDILTRTKEFKFEKIFFIWSHDFFNIDNLAKTTTKGTPQDVDMRFYDMYKKGKRMLIQGIELLRQFAPVETVQVGANHDRLTSYTLSEVLESYFHDDDKVSIDNDPINRKYRRFGKCLIGFSHGDTEKKRLGKIMPVEARKDWGETLFCEIHAAHLHSEQAVVEENGVIVRYLSSPSGTDTWHHESGYVGAIKKTQAFIWDKELGLMDIKNTTITQESLI